MSKQPLNEWYKRKRDQIEVNEDLKQKLASQLNLTPDMKQTESLFVLFKPLIGVTAVFAILAVVVGLNLDSGTSTGEKIVYGEQVDDWKYDADELEEDRIPSNPSGGGFGTTSSLGSSGSFLDSFSSTSSGSSVMSESESLGFSVGGSKDVDSFRTNIENGYLPLVDSITYEGLFYEYFFETGEAAECDELFCPTYAQAVSEDPISGEEEYYLAVGLNSGLTEADFERKKLNLVIVMDISGSMGSSFDRYYYDAFGNYLEVEEYSSKSKMEVANESVVALLDQLNEDDRLGVVLFDDEAYEAKPVRLVGETDMDALEDHILDITPQGGTDMSAGMELGTELLSEFVGEDADEYENRIIFLTDAMPNSGDLSEEGLLGMTERNADDGVYSTFVGIGVDFQSELIESITKVRGANYYSVHSAAEFEERMDEGFEYMVTPLVFDLELKLEADGYDIETVYGSPEADLATGEILYVNTLFPSKTEGGETRGGIILLKLLRTDENGEMRLSANYENRNGEAFSTISEITFDDVEVGTFDHDGVRKGILLSRYVDLIKNWIIDERGAYIEGGEVVPYLDEETGIIAPIIPTGSQWEQTSVPLTVAEAYQELFTDFLEYLEDEMDAIGDDELEKEVDILELLLGAETTDSSSWGEGFFDDWNF